MSTTTKRVASIFLEAKQAEQVLQRLRVDAAKWVAELEKAPKGSKAAADAAKNLAQISSQYNRIERSIRGSNDELKKSEGLYGKLQKQLGPLGTAIAGTFAATAVWSFVKAQGQVVVEFDKMSSRVRAVGPEFKQRFTELREEAIRTGAQMGMTGKEGLQAIEALGKAGLDVNSILNGALQGAMNLAAAGDMPVEMAAEFVAGVQTQFKLVGEDIPHLADLLAAGAGKAQGSVTDLSMAMKQSGLVASQMGISINEDVGVLAAFASNALTGSDAGTSFRTMLLRLSNPSKEAADMMKQLNLNAYDAQGRFVGMASIAGQLKTSMSGLSQAQRDQMLATIFGSDAVRAANVLYQQGAEGIEEWTKKVNDQGFAQDVAAEKLDNLAGDMKKANAAWEAFVLEIESGDGPISRTFRNIVSGFTGMLETLTGTGEVETKVKDFTARVQKSFELLGGSGQLSAERGDAVVERLRLRAQAAQEYGKTVEDLTMLEAARNMTLEEGADLEERFRTAGTKGVKELTEAERIQLAARMATLQVLNDLISKHHELNQAATTAPAEAGAPPTPKVLTEEERKAAEDAAKKTTADLQRLSDTVKKASEEMLRARLSGMEKEVAAERDKYANLRGQAHGNAALISRITELEGQSILAIRAKYAEQEAHAARKLAEEIRAIRAEQVARDGGEEQLALQAIRRDYAQRIDAARTGASNLAQVEAERDSAIEQHLAERAARQAIANEQELQAIRASFAARFDAARTNAEQTLALETELTAAINEARGRQTASASSAPSADNDAELDAIRAQYAERIAAAQDTTATVRQLEDELEQAITTKQVEQFAARKAANAQELDAIRANYAERLAAAQQLATELSAVPAEAGTPQGDAAIGAARNAAAELLGIETELANALALKRQEQVEGVAATQVAITDATVQGYAERMGAIALADRADVDAIIAKYDGLFQAAQGDAARRAELEVLFGNELRDKRTEQLAERQQQLDEWNAKVQDERVAQAEAALAFMDGQHEAELAKAEEQHLDTEAMRARHLEERKALEEELHQAKLEDINAKFEELYALADAQSLDTTDLQRIHGEAIAQLEKEQATQSVRTTEEKNKRIVESERKRNAALKQVGMDMLDAFAAIWTATAGNAQEAELFHKVITGFKIAIDTASAISSIIAGAAVGDPYTAAIRIAAGVTLVLTNIAKATELLRKDPPPAPTFTGTAYASGGQTAPAKTGAPRPSDQARPSNRGPRPSPGIPPAEDITWFDPALGTTVTLSQPPAYKSNIAEGGHVRTPSYGLIGEKGAEWVAPNWQVNHPALQPMFSYLEEVRQRGSVFATGGYTRGITMVNATDTGGSGTPPAAERGGVDVRTTTDPMLLSLLDQNMRINAELSRQLAEGIGVSWDKFEEAQDRIGTIRSTNSLSA